MPGNVRECPGFASFSLFRGSGDRAAAGRMKASGWSTLRIPNSPTKAAIVNSLPRAEGSSTRFFTHLGRHSQRCVFFGVKAPGPRRRQAPRWPHPPAGTLSILARSAAAAVRSTGWRGTVREAAPLLVARSAAQRRLNRGDGLDTNPAPRLAYRAGGWQPSPMPRSHDVSRVPPVATDLMSRAAPRPGPAGARRPS